jgi:hypothetical protein
MPETVARHDLRRHSRTHIFLAALLKTPAGDFPVRIRNMSPTGALVEADILPDPGTPVRLMRGSLETTGETVWHSGSRCGISFPSPVRVEAWLPETSGRQDRVDALVGQIRNNRTISERLASETSRTAEPELALDVLAELARTLGRQLAADPATIARFSFELQGFDLLAQALEALPPQQTGPSRRFADTVGACADLLLRLKTAGEHAPGQALVRDRLDPDQSGTLPRPTGPNI